MAPQKNENTSLNKRKFLLFCAGFAIIYPIIRFLGFSIPRKPRIIELGSSLQGNGFHIGPDFILFDNGKKVWALSRRCTHLGCTINYHEKDELLECPCHQSRFSTEGVVLHGPAKKDLPLYKVEKLKNDGGYIVTI
ncbi:MAG TPA: ubiquinol-cytochrome c reductase iron-sulfur subunit [Desulfobacterales bacterium]|nr:ubiquinol-cytochrome c reductase iron-sulfur subunit [Desulfobacterales bacterium]HIP39572.1 ubiquinol-cytochrome c reductase iron-sulfur subunit [Desulfocapsa sulfexigens]